MAECIRLRVLMASPENSLLPIRHNIVQMSGYAPGEQWNDPDIIKLNTNENPYPPSPRVVEAIQSSLHGDILRKYPQPLGDRFRQAAATVLRVDPESIIVGNGSDDILTVITRACVPQNGRIVSLTPSYTLYKTLAEIQQAEFLTVPFATDWTIPDTPWPEASLTLIANPNSPSGTILPRSNLLRILEQARRIVVIDEAYVEFAEQNCLELLRDWPNVIITRTMSKYYSLAGIRLGYGIAHPDIVRELIKVKDSYNCDVLSLAAATAAIEDQAYYDDLRSQILATRGRLSSGLAELGFQVTSSQANFVWCRWPGRDLQSIQQQLRAAKILVRYMQYPQYGEGIRISVGNGQDIERCLTVLKQVLSAG